MALGGRATRPKKLNAKQNVQIFREEQVARDLIDYDAARLTIETGVEKNEESVSVQPQSIVFALNRPARRHSWRRQQTTPSFTYLARQHSLSLADHNDRNTISSKR
jgi:hypothetical protein